MSDPLHERSARLLDLIHAGHDYADDARRLEWIAEAATTIPLRTLLDVGCGTGRHLEALRGGFAVEGLDRSPAVLAVARQRLPGVTLHEGDLEEFDLGRRFDIVLCLGSAIAYAAMPARLNRAVANLARHANPGGVVLVAPWVFAEEWVDGHIEAELVDVPEIKVARISRGSRRADTSILDVHYLVGEAGGVECFQERHELGLFSDETYRAAFAVAGLDVSFLPDALADNGLYVGIRPGQTG